MDGWMDEWIDGWMAGLLAAWLDGCNGNGKECVYAQHTTRSKEFIHKHTCYSFVCSRDTL